MLMLHYQMHVIKINILSNKIKWRLQKSTAAALA